MVGLALCLAGTAQEQGFHVTGTLIHVTSTDTTAVHGRLVVLHAVGLDHGAPVDSVVSDSEGRFTFESSTIDTLASYLVSVEHDGIGYFSDPFRPIDGNRDTLPPIVVFDTSSTTPRIELAARHVLVHPRETDGTRRIIELFVLANRGTVTRVAPTASQPVWIGRIPEDVLQFEVGLSDMGTDAIVQTGNTIQVSAPIPPGEREMLVSYLLPRGARALRVQLDQPVAHLAVLLGDSTATIEGDRLALVGVEDLEGLPLHRYEARTVGAGTPVTVRFRRERPAATVLPWVVVPLVGIALVFGFVRWWAAHSAKEEVRPPADPTALAAEIAALDAVYAGKEDEEYRMRRAELKERLARMLEGRG